tara:strand:- start:92 stop:643 length:552 start_codon:yes stop_codon:yes gene_type:complete
MKIYGKFVVLKEISLNDSLFIYKLRRNKIISFYLHKPPSSLLEQKNWIKKNLKNKKTQDFVIINKKKNKKIGTIALNKITLNTAEWGRWISKGSTIENIEAIILLLNYAFKKKKMKKIYSLTNINNKKVISFHKNTPAINEGLIKNYFNIKNKNTDAIKYSFNIKNFLKFKNFFDVMTQSIQL